MVTTAGVEKGEEKQCCQIPTTVICQWLGLTRIGNVKATDTHFSPVTVNALSRPSRFVEQIRAQVSRPSSSSGQLNACIAPDRNEKSSDRPLTSRWTMAVTAPLDVSRGLPLLSKLGIGTWFQSSVNARGGGGPSNIGGDVGKFPQAHRG